MILHRLSSMLLIVGLLGITAASHGTAPPTGADGAALSPFWQVPSDLPSRDLFNGPWGASMAPDPNAVYTFAAKKQSGVNPGVIVRDPQGRRWHVKQAPDSSRGAEGPVEVVLSRVLSAIGYHQPPVFFLPSFTMVGESGSTRVEPGGRFRLDDESMTSSGHWSWKRNPFVGTKPYQGLLVTLLVFNSWDLKDSNNTIYDVSHAHHMERWYVVRDLGAAFGASGRLAVKRNNIDRFERHPFITSVSNGFVEFSYGGWQPELIRHTITVDDVRWATELLAFLSDQQWHDAFRAGGYPPDLADRFIRKIRANIVEGQRVANGTWSRGSR